MTSKLRVPLQHTIADGFDEADVQRLWRCIQAHERPSRGGWLRVPLMVCAALLLVVALVASPGLRPSAGNGPLLMITGEIPSTSLVEPAASARRLELQDGSFIVAESHTRLDVLANGGEQFLVALRYGAIRVNVHPGGARRWAIESGPVRVEVVGTAFDLQRSGDHVRLSVLRGTVIAKGERVPGHVQRLTAGGKLDVLAHDPSIEQVPTTLNEVLRDVSDVADDASAKASAVEGHAEPRGAKIVLPSLQELVDRAEAARRLGDRKQAILLLKQVLAQGRSQPQGAVAALILARLTVAEDPTGVARALSAVLGSGVPQGLDEDVRARLVEALARSGDHVGARRAAQEYQRRYPHGTRLVEIQRWTAE